MQLLIARFSQSRGKCAINIEANRKRKKQFGLFFVLLELIAHPFKILSLSANFLVIITVNAFVHTCNRVFYLGHLGRPMF